MPLFIPSTTKKTTMKFLKDYDAQALFGVVLIVVLMATILTMFIQGEF
jgi:hypothetical protein